MPDIFVAEHKGKKDKAKEIVEKKNQQEKKRVGHLKRFVKLLTGISLRRGKLENSLNMFSTFCVNPSGITFEDQKDNETILLFLRKHFITNLPWISIGLVLFLLPPFLYLSYFLNFSGNPISFINLPPNYLIIILLSYYLGVFIFIFVNYATWFFNISLFTSERIINVNFSELVYKHVESAKFELLEDLDYNQTGFIRSMFDYGDIDLQVIGLHDVFHIYSIPHPEQIIRLVEGMEVERK